MAIWTPWNDSGRRVMDTAITAHGDSTQDVSAHNTVTPCLCISLSVPPSDSLLLSMPLHLSALSGSASRCLLVALHLGASQWLCLSVSPSDALHLSVSHRSTSICGCRWLSVALYIGAFQCLLVMLCISVHLSASVRLGCACSVQADGMVQIRWRWTQSNKLTKECRIWCLTLSVLRLTLLSVHFLVLLSL